MDKDRKISDNDKKFMLRAIKLAGSNVTDMKGGPFGAVVVRSGQIIGEGANLVTLNNDPTAHAEIVAIREACNKLNTFHLEGSVIYASCQPCPMCLGAIYWARIDKIFYAASSKDAHKAYFDDAHIYNEFLVPAQKRKIPHIQILQTEARKVFTDWVNSENKIPY
jgi:tRNA(Arg) A34 adenosine deaminase TadA